MAKKKRKLFVKEVSLAKYPKNKEPFLIVMEDKMKDRLERLIATLAKKADVPEVVKEEMKAWDQLSEDEFSEVLEYLLPKKAFEDERKAFEEKEKAWKEEKKALEEEKKGLEEEKKTFEAENKSLKKDLLQIKLEAKVGDYSEVLMSLSDKLDEDDLEKLADSYKSLEEKINREGEAVGTSEESSKGLALEDAVEDLDAYREAVKKAALKQ